LPQPASTIQSRRPDSRAGVFETILIFEDRPIELAAHLARLEASVRALYDAPPPPAREQVIDHCRGGWLGRLRLTVEPGRDGELRNSIVVGPFDPNNVFPTGPFATALRSFEIESGWGDHKWADRDALSRAEASVGPGVAPILVTPAGEVLEASRANVFAVHDRTLTTPPLDGSILPGVARAGVIHEAREIDVEVREEPVTLADLLSADEVFLTGSLRGVEPIREIDGVPIPSEGAITRALADALRQRWFAGSP
jgi:para-aminobenzoate synthetase/4-amino-4-deoxychorismate lyase